MGVVGEFGFERRSNNKGLVGEDSLKEELARVGGGERLYREVFECGSFGEGFYEGRDGMRRGIREGIGGVRQEGAFCEGRVRGASVRTAGRGVESVRRGG